MQLAMTRPCCPLHLGSAGRNPIANPWFRCPGRWGWIQGWVTNACGHHDPRMRSSVRLLRRRVCIHSPSKAYSDLSSNFIAPSLFTGVHGRPIHCVSQGPSKHCRKTPKQRGRSLTLSWPHLCALVSRHPRPPKTHKKKKYSALPSPLSVLL